MWPAARRRRAFSQLQSWDATFFGFSFCRLNRGRSSHSSLERPQDASKFCPYWGSEPQYGRNRQGSECFLALSSCSGAPTVTPETALGGARSPLLGPLGHGFRAARRAATRRNSGDFGDGGDLVDIHGIPQTLECLPLLLPVVKACESADLLFGNRIASLCRGREPQQLLLNVGRQVYQVQNLRQARPGNRACFG